MQKCKVSYAVNCCLFCHNAFAFLLKAFWVLNLYFLFWFYIVIIDNIGIIVDLSGFGDFLFCLINF